MLLNAYQELAKEAPERRLLFVPVSINHEYVPEGGALSKELKGRRKIAESGLQLLGLVKFFAYRFGSVHIRLGRPIPIVAPSQNLKQEVEALSIQCFRKVGENLVVTPSAILSMVLLDEPVGALRWDDILAKARSIAGHCEEFKVPLSSGLQADKLEQTLERTMDIFVGNKKIEVIGRNHKGNIYYLIRRGCRRELLYFKNTILHHFLIPALINLAWVNLLRGELESGQDLKHFFLEQRRQLKYEFYLPTVKQVFYKTLSIVSKAVGRRVVSLEEIMELSRREIYSVIQKVGVFGRSLSYLLEGYYLSALAVRMVGKEFPEGVKQDVHLRKVKDLYQHEVGIGHMIRYSESFSVELVKSSLNFFRHLKMVEQKEGMLKVIDAEKVDKLIERYEKDLVDLVTFNIRIQ